MCARVCCLWVAKFDGQHNSFNCILLIIRLGFPCYHQSINNLLIFLKKTKFYTILFLIAFMSSSLHISLVIILFF